MPDITRRRVLSATMPSSVRNNINRVEDLGCFDEESCRYYLREVGSRVVPFYPFAFGMEEVYSLILEKYGYAGLPDATSVLQDLLESDGSAGGLGDDGDIWRSWRHSWRHRNDDRRKPFVPKVGNFVLQPPTQPHIRLLKAQNFIRKTETANSPKTRSPLAPVSGNRGQRKSSLAAETKPKDSEDEEDPLPATTFSHQRCRAWLASQNGSPPSRLGGPRRASVARRSEHTEWRPQQEVTEESSQQEATEQRSQQEVTEELSQQEATEQRSQQQVTEEPTPLLDTDIDASLFLAFEMLTAQSSQPEQMPTMRGGQGDIYRLQQVDQPNSAAIDQSPPAIPAPDAGLRSPDNLETLAALEENQSAETQCETFEEFRAVPRIPSSDHPGPSRRRRAMNREARLIDGNIITPHGRMRLPSQNSVPSEVAADVDERRTPTMRKSWTPARQKPEPRHSWLRTFFRSASQTRHAKVSQESRSPGQPEESRRAALPVKHNTENNLSDPVARLPPFAFGLDGTFDTLSILSRASMELNKPLPLTPSEVVRSLSARTNLPFPRQPATVMRTSSTKPTMSTQPRATPGHPNHLGLTIRVPSVHEFMPPTEVESKAAAGMSEPAKSVQPQACPNRYSNIARMNPFAENAYLNVARMNPFVHNGTSTSFAALTPPPLIVNPFILNPYSNIDRTNPSAENAFQASFAALAPPPLVVPRYRAGAESTTQPAIPGPQAYTQDPNGPSITTYDSKGCAPSDARHAEFCPASPPSRHTSKRSIKLFLPGSKHDAQEDKGNTSTHTRVHRHSRSKNASLQKLGDFIKHPFASQHRDQERFEAVDLGQPKVTDQGQLEATDLDRLAAHDPEQLDLTDLDYLGVTDRAQVKVTDKERSRHPLLATNGKRDMLPIYLDPALQACIMAELNLLISTATNNFLLEEADAGRLDPQVIEKAKKDYKAKHGVDVVEFLFDTVTQYQVVKANYENVMFHEELEENMFAIMVGMEKWGNIVAIISKGILCNTHETITRCVYGMRTPLLMLRAPWTAITALYAIQLKTLQGLLDGSQARRLRMTAPQVSNHSGVQRPGAYMYRKRSIDGIPLVDKYPGIDNAVERLALRPERGNPQCDIALPPRMPHPIRRFRRTMNPTQPATVDGPGPAVPTDRRHGQFNRS